MAQRKSLKPGVCGFMNPVCALEEPSCVEDVDFLSSREMEGGASGHGGDCANQSKLRKINVGRCVGGPCAPNVESCGSSNDFIPNDVACTVGNTIYGKCGERCSWSPNDCLSGEFWKFPADDCSCDQVQVGACKLNYSNFESYTCAVSALGCDDSSVWVNPLDLPIQSNIECFLCRQVTLAPDPAESLAPAPAESADVIEKLEPIVIKEKKNNSNTVAVTSGLVCGIFIAVCATTYIIVFRRRRQSVFSKSNNRGKDDDSIENAPPKSIDIFSNKSQRIDNIPDADEISDIDLSVSTDGSSRDGRWFWWMFKFFKQ